MRTRALILILFIQASPTAFANPLANKPAIPQVCRITYGIKDRVGIFKRVGYCLGTLIGVPGTESSNQVLTAGHCAPEKIFRAFKDYLPRLPQVVREEWDERMRKGKRVINLACGSEEFEILEAKTQVHPDYSSVALWLWLKMLKERTGPYPVDLATIQLRTPISIPPLAVNDSTVDEVLQEKRDCFVTILSEDGNHISLTTADKLYSEELIPVLALREEAEPLIKAGDSGGPLVCHDGEGGYKVAGVNSLMFEKLHASFIQHITPEIVKWLSARK